jgi:predicted dehydrogenase
MGEALRVLVVGLGSMGLSDARAYGDLDGFALAGLCARTIGKRTDLPEAWSSVSRFSGFDEALVSVRPDVVSINPYPDTHAQYAIRAIEAGAHVFVEKPLAQTVANAQRVVDAAKAHGRKLMAGYILRVHPSWTRFVELARTLGKPLVMRMNVNQQSIGAAWTWHCNLMQSLSPPVDCGVHYVDIMCQMSGARRVRVHGIGARLADNVKVPDYGHLHVEFDDGSVGWYEAGWGPMMSEVLCEGRRRPEGLRQHRGGRAVGRRGGGRFEDGVFRHRQPYQDKRASAAPCGARREQCACARRRDVPHGR